MKMRVLLAATAIVLATSPAVFADRIEGVKWMARGQFGNAYRELKESAEQGDALAARYLGFLLERGMKVQGGQTLEARPEEAAKWYRKAAEGGDRQSMMMMGVLYATGRGLPQDFAESLRWFDKVQDPGCESWIDKYPAEDRDAICAWHAAVRFVARREVRYPRGAAARNGYGKVKLVFDAESATVSIAESDAIKLLEAESERAGRVALEIVPPPPAARREKVKVTSTMDFRIVDEFDDP